MIQSLSKFIFNKMWGWRVDVAEPVPQNSNREAAVSALIVLGYTRPEAVKAVSGVTESGLSTEEIIRQALKNT